MSEVKKERTRVYLSSLKACEEFAKMFITEGFAVKVGKVKQDGKRNSKPYFEYWREED